MKTRYAAALVLVVFFAACTNLMPVMEPVSDDNWGGVPESRLLASWRTQFLNQSKGSGSEDHVIAALGPPTLIQKTGTGDMVVYKFSGAGVGGSFCTSYVLKFDSGKVLRSWTRDSSCTG